MLDFGVLLPFTIISFFFLFIVNKNKIITIFDPIIYQLIIFAFAFAGLLTVGSSFMNYNFTFFTILIIIMLFSSFFIGNVKQKNINLQLNISKDLQILYLLFLLIILIMDLVVNLLLSGNIPLFMDYNASMRIEATQHSRILYYLSGSVGFISVIFFALSEVKLVKSLSFLLLLLGILKTILFASKAFILNIIIMYAIYYFLKSLKYTNSTDNYIEKKKINKAKYKLILFLIIGFTVLPFYMYYQGHGFDLALIFARLYHGFDSLIFTIVYDLNINGAFEKFNIGMYSLYLMPFLKGIFGMSFEYDSVSAYILNESLHITEKQALPNSNMMLELVITNGYLIALIVLPLLFMCIMYIRKQLLMKRKLSLINLILFYYIVLTPYNLIMFGYQEFLKILLSLLIYIFIIFIFSILPKRRKHANN